MVAPTPPAGSTPAGPVGPPPGGPVPAGPPPAAPAPARPRSGQRAVLLGVLITVSAAATIGAVAFLGWRFGAVPLAVGIAGAILPVPVLVACFLWLDRYEPSPTRIMVACFFWGAGVAVVGSALVQILASWALESTGRADAITTVLVAPAIEEALKAALPLLLFVFYRKAFTGVIDGIVYCGLSATGFAMVENIGYIGGLGYIGGSEFGAAGGGAAALSVFVQRVFLTGFAHPMFTAMTALGLGFAVRSPRRAVRVLAPLTGLVAAMTLHALWNLMASFGLTTYVFLYGYFAVFVPIFFVVVGLVLWVRSWEGRLAERVLPVYAAAGWFSPPEVVALGGLGRRLSARVWARRVAGEPGRTAMKSYQYAATRLALLRDGLNRGVHQSPGDIAGAVVEERRLLDEIDQYRRVFTGRDPLTPRAWWSAGAYQIVFPDGVIRTVAEPPMPVVPVPIPRAGTGLPGT